VNQGPKLVHVWTLDKVIFFYLSAYFSICTLRLDLMIMIRN
jgi:hypothetical protein